MLPRRCPGVHQICTSGNQEHWAPLTTTRWWLWDIWQCGSIFIRLAVVAAQKCELVQNSEIWTYSSSRSSKVGDFDTNRKRIRDFPLGLVINSNFVPILHRFGTATYWPKIAYFSYPSFIRRPRSLCSLWHFAVKITMRKLESWGYSAVKVAWS